MLYLNYRRNYINMVKPLSVRFSTQLMRKLERVSVTVDRPRSYLIRKAVESYLQEYAEYQTAMNRLQDKDDKIISSLRMKKRLGL